MKAFFTLSNTGRRSRLALLPLFMSILLCIGVGQKAWGQTALTVHDGTTTNSYVPVYGFYADAYLKSEFVIPASDLSQMAGGSISSMKFYASQSSVSWGSAYFQVFLKEVSSTSISSFSGPGTTVYQGSLSISGGEMTINFSNPYHYGGGNLLVGIYNTVEGSYVSSSWYGETVSGASVQGYSYSDLASISPTQRDFIPKTTFYYTPGSGGGSECPTVHDGTTTNNYVPVYGFYADAYLKSEFVIPSTDIPATSGTITEMTFYASTPSVSWGSASFQVFLSEVSSTSISAFSGPGTIVYEGSLSIDANGEMHIPFTHNYNYNGGNLLVGIYNTVEGSYVTSSWYGETVTGASVQGYSYSDLASISPTQRNFIPKTTFCITPDGGGGTAPVTTECEQIGQGTGTTYYFPIDNYFNYSCTEQIYLASEVGDAGTITSIKFYYNYGTSYTASNVTMYMKNVSRSSFASTSDYEPLSSNDIVWTGNIAPTGAGWYTFTLNTPFEYDGTSNLLVAFYDGTSGYPGTSYTWLQTTSPNSANMALRYYSDSSNPDPYNLGTYSGSKQTYTYRANMEVCVQRISVPTSTLTTSVSPAETGTITFDPNPTYSGNRYEIGTEVELTATPEEGYTFSSWSIDGIATSISTPTITLTMDEDHSVVANFAPLSYTVSVSAAPAEYGTVSGGGSYDYGSSCTVTATPSDAAYRFANWTQNGNVVSTDASYTFTIPAENCSLVANFVLTPYTLTTSANPNAGGTVTHHSITNPTSNTSETVEIVDASSTANYVTYPVNFVWAYTENQMLLYPNEIGQAGVITSLAYQRYSGGSGSPETRNIDIYMKHTTMSAYSSTADWVAVGPADLVFSGNYTFQTSGNEWQTIELNTPFNYNGTDNLLICIDDNTGSTTTSQYWWCRTTSANRGMRAWSSSNFDPTVAGTPSGGSSNIGTYVPNMVIGFAGGGGGTGYASNEYAPNDEVEITATPNYGYTFADWTIDGTTAGSDNPTTLIMDDDHTVVANFDPIPYTVSVSTTPAEHSTATGDGVYDYGTSCTVTASPIDNCYQFVNWTQNGTVVSTQASYTFTVTSDCALVAHFTIPAPASLTVSNITGSSADLSWTGNAESYDLVCYPTVNPTEVVFSDNINTNTLNPNFNNSVTTSYPWNISTTSPHSGSYCMTSGNYNVSSSTSSISLTYTLTADGFIEFYSRVSSESSWDKGHFYIDGTEELVESGSSSWTLRSYAITAGEHTFTWSYTKDGSVNSNEDHYYIDDIVIKEELPAEPVAAYSINSPYTLCGLVPNTTYEVQLQSICGGEYGLTASRTFTTNGTTIPFSAGTITEGTYAPCGDFSESQTINSLIETDEVEVEITEPITIGDGTGTTYYGPFNSLWGYSFVEQVYTAAEIGSPCIITSISFNMQSTSTQTNAVDVFMKHVSRTNFADGTDWESVTSSDMVFSGTVTFSSGWTTITLNEPFEYDGTSNLMVALHEYTSGYSTLYFYYTTVTGGVISAHSDSENPNPYNIGAFSGTKYVQNYRVNIRLGVSGTGTISTTTFDGSATGNHVEYQWKLDNEPIEGATSDSYTVTVAEMEGLTPSLHTYTRWVKDACNDWEQSEGQYILDLRVPGNPEITEIPTDLLCGDQATLNVSSENSSNMQLMYFWYNEYPISNNIQPIAHSEDQYITQPLSLGTNTLYVQAVSYRVENDIDTIWQCTSEPTEVTLTAAPFEAAATAEIMPNTCGNFFTLQIEGNPTPNHTYVWYSDADCTHEVGRGYSYTLADRQTETATYYLREYAWEVEGGTYLCQSSNTNSVVVTVLPLEAPSTLNDTYEICKGEPLNIEAFGESNDEQGLLDPYIVWFTSSDATEWIDTTASSSPLSRQIADVSTTLYAATASYIDSYSGPMHLSAPAATQTNYGNAVYFDITAGNSPIVLDSIDLHVRSGQGTGVQQQVYVYNGSIENVNPIDPNIWGLRNTTMDYDGGEHAIIHFSDPISLEPNETISLLINTSNAMQLYYNMESQIQLGDVLASNNFMTIHKGYGFQYTSDFQIGFPSAYPNPLSFCGTIHFDVEGELHFGCMSEDRTAVAVIVDSLPQVGTFDDPEPLCNGDNLTEEVLEELLPEIIWNTISDDPDSRIEVWMVSVNDEEPELLTDDMRFYYGDDYTLIRKAINNCGENQSEAHITVYAPPAFTEEADIPEEICANTPIELDMPMWDETGTDEETWWEYTSVEEEDYQELDTELGIPAIGQYYIRARIENSCGGNATDPVLVEVRDLPTIAAIEETEIATCFGQEINPDVPEVEYNLSQGTATWVLVQDDEVSDPIALTFPQTADMDWDGVRICYAATNDCGTTYSDTITLTVHPDIALTVTSDFEQNDLEFICPAVGAELTASTADGIVITSYEWTSLDEGGGLVETTGNPVHARRGTVDEAHYYQVIATDEFGCHDTATTTVAIIFHDVLTYDTIEICENELPFTYGDDFSDTTLQRPGTHIVYLPQPNGCDNAVSLTLNVREYEIIDFHYGLCGAGDSYTWEFEDYEPRTYTESARDTIRISYTSAPCDSLLLCITVTQGEPYLVVTDPQLTGSTGEALSTTVFGRTECENSMKVAIEYDLYKDGEMVNPDDYGTLNFTTAIPDLNLSFGRNVHAASGSIPANTFNMYNYQYGYFYLNFFAYAPNTVTATWNEPGEYKIVFRVVGRTGGMDYPYQSTPGVVIGGGGGTTTMVYATDSLIMYVNGESGNEGQDASISTGDNGMIAITPIQYNPVIGATSTIGVDILNPNDADTSLHVALDYEVYRDGQLLSLLDGYGTMTFATFYDGTNAMVGRALEFPDGSIPSASFRVSYYNYGYFKLGFWAQTTNEFTASWQQPGEYKVVFRLVERTGGTPYDLTYGDGTYTIGGGNGTNTGNVLDTSAITFYIPVAEPAEADLDTIVCENDLPVIIHGTEFSDDAQEDLHVYSDNGVYDTIYHLTLTVAPAYTAENPVELDTVVCAGAFPFEWNGVTFEEADSQTANLQTVLGCDSVVLMTVNVSTETGHKATETACGSFTWQDGDGLTYTESGTYTYNYENDYGCTLTDTLELTVHDVTTTPDVVTWCGSYEWNGETYYESGTYTYDREVEYDNDICMVTDTLVLTISTPLGTADTMEACGSYEWHGTTYTTSGTKYFDYEDYDINAGECPHVDTLYLIIHEVTPLVETETGCNEFYWQAADQTYYESGTYTYDRENEFGCPVTDTLHLTISQPNGEVITVEACESYEWHDRPYTESGEYYYDYQDADVNGGACPHVDTLRLTISQPYGEVFTVEACGEYTWIDGEEPITQSGTYTHEYQEGETCPRIDTLVLTINPVYAVEDELEISVTELPYTYADTTFELGTQSGEFTVHMLSTSGCDSIVTLTLTVSGGSEGDAFLTVENISDSEFEVVAFANQVDPTEKVAIAYSITKDGEPVNIVSHDCGGELNISTEFNGNFVGQNVSYGEGYIPGNTFRLSSHYHDYFYFHFLNGRANRISHSFTEEGEYEITLTLMSRDGGTDIFVPYSTAGGIMLIGGEGSADGDVLATTTITFSVSGGGSNEPVNPAPMGVGDYGQMPDITLFPNPARDIVTLRTNVADADCTVTDMSGKVVLSATADQSSDLQINVSQWAAGVYFVNLRSNGSTVTKKLVITK